MHIIDLTYVELGIHEELVAYFADQENCYQLEGVHVAPRDGRAWDPNGSGGPPRSARAAGSCTAGTAPTMAV